MKLAVRESGSTKGLPIVLIHAFPLSAQMWEPQAKALESYRVLAPDLRGFGDTPLAPPWFIEHAVDDLAQTLSALGVESAIVAGLSMGGYVALRFAEKYPGRVRALVLCDTRAEADANANKVKRAAAVDVVRRDGVGAFVGPFLKDALAPSTWNHRPEIVSFLRGIAEKASAEAVMAALAALAARGDMTGSLSAIKVPTLILVGEQDKITPPALSEAMTARISGSQLKVIPDAGHFSNVENPAAFNEALAGFLRRV